MDGGNLVKGGGGLITVGLLLSVLFFMLGSQSTALLIGGIGFVVVGALFVIFGRLAE